MPYFYNFTNKVRNTLFFFFCFPFCALATHNLAGDISLTHLSGRRYQITLVTYTDPAPAGVDRCSADLEVWTSQGENSALLEVLQLIGRSNGPVDNDPPSDCELSSTTMLREGENISRSIKRSVYVIEYEFPSLGAFEIRYFDIARREDIINLPNPGETSFFVSTHIQLSSDLEEANNSPLLLNEPIETACVGSLWVHNPGVLDQDGDSLAFRLVSPREYDSNRGLAARDIPNYKFPDDPSFQADPTISSSLQMDAISGLISWESPSTAGVYSLAYQIDEYRDGIILGSVRREIIIIVKACENSPPRILLPFDYPFYLSAGSSWELSFKVWDPNASDSLYFELNHGFRGNNGPFSTGVSSSAEIFALRLSDSTDLQNLPFIAHNQIQRVSDSLTMIDTLQVRLNWTPGCSDIRTQPYQIDLNAYDNYTYRESASSTQTYNQRALPLFVLPPPPTEVKVDTSFDIGNQIGLRWEPASCTEVIGYQLYFLSETSTLPTQIAEISGRENTSIRINAPTTNGFFFLSSIAIQSTPTWDRHIIGLPSDSVFVTTLAVSNLDLIEDRFQIFPNPTNEFLTVKIVDYSPDQRLKLLDIQGRVLKSIRIPVGPIWKLSLQDVSSGVYIVEVWEDKERIYGKKILKN